MRQIRLIAGKEIRDGLRNRWVISITVLLALFALTLAFLGAAPTGAVKVSPLTITVVSLSSLTIFLLPLIALLLSYDAIVGEQERGTLPLLLAYPVTRWQVILGKFTGHVLILTFATVVGYGAAGAAIAWSDSEGIAAAWSEFAGLIGSSILLGGAFVALGYLASVLVRDRGMAGGLAIGIWLLFVLIYDMGVLGLLVADQGRTVTAGILTWLLLLNPADAYRLLNLTGTANVSALAGMAGLAAEARFGPAVLVAALVLWAAVPLATAGAVFARREL
jgi:Cu-processing system permease protein